MTSDSERAERGSRFWRVMNYPLVARRPRATSESIRAAIWDAELPVQLAELAEGVTRRTRLWRRERLDVARELVSHFRDGLEAGASADQLSARFGNPGRTAALIRASKKRNRPLIWHAWIRSWQAMGLIVAILITIYGILQIRFHVGEIRIERNFAAELNASLAGVPERDRAWPIYKQALRAQPEMPEWIMQSNYWPAVRPDNPEWESAVEFLEANRETLDLIRQGASRPRMGIQLQDQMERDLVEIQNEQLLRRMPGAVPLEYQGPSENPMMISILLPHLGYMRGFARLLAFDIRHATATGDGDRIVADLETLLGMANQMDEHSILIEELVGLAIYSLAADNLARVLGERPDLFSDDQLVSLAHRFAASGTEHLSRPDFSGERLMFEDMLQRLFTDDGSGGGHVNAEGLSNALYLGMPPGANEDALLYQLDKGQLAFGPVFSAVIANRRELREVWNRYISLAEAEASRPLWERGESEAERFMEDIESDPIRRARYLPFSVMAPSVSSASRAFELAKMTRDVSVTAIALELYRRRYGNWPEALDALVPEFLPALPVDRFDGRTLRYDVRDGRAWLWSVGGDRDDDGGRWPEGERGPSNARQWRTPAELEAAIKEFPRNAASFDGDWILWPADTEPKQPE